MTAKFHRTLTLEGCNIEVIYREKLRVDGILTNCDTGDRLVISKPLTHPLPRSLQIGKYWGRIFHPSQVETDHQNRENEKEKLSQMSKASTLYVSMHK